MLPVDLNPGSRFRIRSIKICLALPLALASSLLIQLPSVSIGDTLDSKSDSPSNLTSPAKFGDHRWFYYLSAGVGRASYDDETNGAIDRAKAVGNESPQTGFFDLPGVYYRIDSGLAIGAVLTMSFENFARNWRNPESFAIQTYSPSASAFYFFGGRMGEGWFARSDLGATRVYQREMISTGANQYSERLSNRNGVFGQIAFGYGWDASEMARVLVHINALASRAENNTVTGLALNIGFLL